MLEHSYRNLPKSLYRDGEVSSFPSATVMAWNQSLATELGIQEITLSDQLSFGAGQPTPKNARPTALAYAGHQFGHFVPVLGDGRALLMGELTDQQNNKVDLQLKGIGRTPFSRRGDGFSALGPVIREYLVSEAMHALAIPTTRALCAVRTGQMVQRTEIEPGGILARIASSHIRIGTFEYLYAQQDHHAIKQLAQYCIDRHDPQANESDNPILTFYENLSQRLCRLVVQWMRVGFIHGVMNTDNMAISGQTIDYGPCAFMDHFQSDKTFSSIDQHGRYANNQQPSILFWNLAVMANCLVEVVDSSEVKGIEMLQSALEKTQQYFHQQWLEQMSRKLGLTDTTQNPENLLEVCFQWLEEEKLDYTQTFDQLTQNVSKPTPPNLSTTAQNFYSIWKKSLAHQNADIHEVQSTMAAANPVCIPRNHLIHQAIQESYHGNDSLFNELHNQWKTPYSRQGKELRLLAPPLPHQVVLRTFCGT